MIRSPFDRPPMDLGRPNRAWSALVAALLWLCTGQRAVAHVKWFCAYNVATTPQPLDRFIDRDFLELITVALLVFMAAGLMDRMFLGRAIVWSVDRTTTALRPLMPTLMRATYGGFFLALWTLGGIILTPELTTHVAAISWIQLAMALCFVWERTLVVAAAGIVGLYAYAISQYGLFHMLDYPIFLGAAAYFALTGLRRTAWGRPPLDVVRYAAAVTLIWASVEKWGYPQWTYPLFVNHPAMGMGFTFPFYMQSAGIVEFSLAFALLGTSLMRRTSAIILTSMFTAAIFGFGKVDAIGHAPIIVVLINIATDSRRDHPLPVMLPPVGYMASLVLIIGAYYGIHAALF